MGHTTTTDLDEALQQLADDTAREVGTYLLALREISAGQSPETALPMLLLATTQIQVTGARLGAMVDVVPQERFEPDTGPDTDLDVIRDGLVRLLGPVEEYADLTDPVLSAEATRGSLVNDLTAVAADIQHGMRHHRQSRIVEALWWWQFSYLSSWGDRCAAATRVLHSLLSHVRLDADEEAVMEAEMAALHEAVDPRV